MENVIEKVYAIKDSKERQRFLENFRNIINNKDNENISGIIFRKAVDYFNNGDDEYKTISFSVINKIYVGFSSRSHFMGKLSVTDSEIKYEEVLNVLYKAISFMKSENGNLRISAANCMNHFRMFLHPIDYVELFYNLLSLKNSLDDKKVKTVVFCLNKIYCPYLEQCIKSQIPNETKLTKISTKGLNKAEQEKANKVERLINKYVKETRKYIKKILKLRGENMFNNEFCLYVNNIGWLQLSYEIQNIFEEKESQEDIINYINFRIVSLLEYNIKFLEGINDRNEISYIDIDSSTDSLFISNLEELYKKFSILSKNIKTKFSR